MGGDVAKNEIEKAREEFSVAVKSFFEALEKGDKDEIFKAFIDYTVAMSVLKHLERATEATEK